MPSNRIGRINEEIQRELAQRADEGIVPYERPGSA